MKVKISSLIKLICLVFATVHCIPLQEPEDIQSVRQRIIITLNQSAPLSLPFFIKFSHQYEQLVQDFFDIQNNVPYQDHIHSMEQNLAIVAQLIKKPEFACVSGILINLYPQLVDLIETLKQYTDSKNYISLALSVRRFKYLIPDSIRKRGDISILWSLRHRLLTR